MRFSSGKRSSELLPAIWSNTPRVVLGSRYGKPLEAANRQSCLALTSRTGLCRGRSLGDQVEGAVGDTFRDRSQGVIVFARMGLKHEERLIHRPPRLGKRPLGLLDDHATVQRPLQLLGDHLRLGGDALLEDATTCSCPVLPASMRPPAWASRISLHSVTGVCSSSTTS